MRQFLYLIPSNPKYLFLLDGIGALVSAFFLGFVLVQLETYFGMHSDVLYGLTGIALIFACYSISCYAFTPTKWRIFLKGIAITNSLYCCLTLGLVIIYYHQLTLLGLIYFILEMIITVLLVRVELLAIR